MRIFALLLGTLLALGCSKAANNKLDEIADRACACKDAECARKIADEFAAWRKEYEGAKGDQAQAEKSTTRIVSCLMKVGGEKTMDKVMDKMEHAGEKAREAGERAGEATEHAGEKTREAVERAGEAVERAGEAVERAGEKTREAADKAREAADKAREAAGKPDEK
jgi:outer membrane murein-binding lipoprotein Lpp